MNTNRLSTKIEKILNHQVTKEAHKEKIVLNTADKILEISKREIFFVSDIKKQYLKDLLHLIETKYGKILDKCNYIFLSGGGSTFFKTTEDGFIRVPKTKVEFYNSIGFGLFGLTKIQSGN